MRILRVMINSDVSNNYGCNRRINGDVLMPVTTNIALGFQACSGSIFYLGQLNEGNSHFNFYTLFIK